MEGVCGFLPIPAPERVPTAHHVMKDRASRQSLPRSAAELGIYRAYERARRQRMLRVMLPLAAALFWVLSVILTVRIIHDNALATYWLLYVAVLMTTLSFTLGVVTIRRGQVTAAAVTMILTGSLGLLFLMSYQVFLLPAERLDPYTLSEFLLFGCVITLVGVLGNLWMVIGATLVVNVLTVLMVYDGPRSYKLATVTKVDFDSITVAALILEWLIAAFLIANWSTYRREMLRTLGAAYARTYHAERLDDLKDRFIMHINHELRTPIMVLCGNVDLLRQVQLSPDEVTARLERAGRAGAELLALLAGMQEVQRMESLTDPFVPAAVSVLETLETTLARIDPKEAGRVQVMVPNGVAILGEPVRFQQLVTNLLSNALKYSSPDTPIEITGQVVAQAPAGSRRQRRKHQHPTLVELRVRDYGLGIPPEQSPLLFHRFVRLPRDLASSVAGSGLGLYLCRVMAESMEGTIQVESSGVEGEGSTFIIRLPLAPTQTEPTSHPIPADRAASA